MHLSIVTTMYYSASYIDEFYRRCCAEAEKLTTEFEIIFVNDGSPDDSLTVATSIVQKDPRVKVVDLSRNFGHHKAMMTGLAHTQGDLIFLIDCDLEEAPETLAPFHDKLNRTGADVIYGVQEQREGSLVDRAAANLFYTTFNLLSNTQLPKHLTTVRIMSRRYVNALLEHTEKEVCIAGLWAITGFEQLPVMIKKSIKGTTTYDFARKLTALVNAITSFSNKPLLYIFYLGCLILLVSTSAAAYLGFRRVFFQEYLSGWPSIMVSIWMLGGLTIFCIGLIGIYLSKIFIETKQRPYTIVRQVYQQAFESTDCSKESATQHESRT